MAVIAIGGDDLIALPYRHLHAHNHRFLADIEMAEAADLAHAVKLAGLFLEAAYEEHQPVGAQLILVRKLRRLPVRAWALRKIVEHGWPFLVMLKLRLFEAASAYLVPL